MNYLLIINYQIVNVKSGEFFKSNTIRYVENYEVLKFS